MEKGLTKMNLFLGGLGILVLASFVVLPPVFRLTIKDNKTEGNHSVPVPTPQPFVSGVMTCQKSENLEIGVVGNTYQVYLENSNISLIAYTKTTTVSGELDQDNKSYEDKKTTYNNFAGYFYDYALSPSSITENYRVTASNAAFPITIESLSLENNITSIQNTLNQNGYTCNNQS